MGSSPIRPEGLKYFKDITENSLNIQNNFKLVSQNLGVFYIQEACGDPESLEFFS